MRKLALGLLGAAALVGATSANAQTAEITFDDTTAIAANNDFITQLNGLGLNVMAAGPDTDIELTADAVLSFFYLGSESSYTDTFTAGTVNAVESDGNAFPNGIYLGSDWFAAGSLIGDLLFGSTNGGVPAGLGSEGFGIFLPANYVSGTGVTEFYIGYDDQVTGPDDDNHDDFLVKVTLVPEPGTWAMMLLGFGAVGFAMRRRRQPVIAQLA